MFLKSQELPAITAEIRMHGFYFRAIGGEHLFCGAGQGKTKSLNTSRPVFPNPVRKLHPIMADKDKRTPQRSQIGANVERHAYVTAYDNREDQREICRRDNPINPVRPGMF